LSFKLSPSQRGFTLIELVVVIVIIGILAIVAFPRFTDLSRQAKISVTQGNLGNVRAAAHLAYADSITGGGAPAFPAALTGAEFTDGKIPVNILTDQDGVATVAVAPGGTATSATDGFWYIQATGVVGAYSDGTVDTAAW